MRARRATEGKKRMEDMILILNYSNEFSMEMARRLRAEHVCAKIVGGDVTAQQVRALSPKGLILSGEAKGSAASLDEEILKLGIPVLAMGHTAKMLLSCMGGAGADAALEEKKAAVEYGESELFAEIADGERYIKLAYTLMLPPDVREIASAGGCTIAFEHMESKLYGVQFELERNDPEGTAILFNFAQRICACTEWWTTERSLEQAQETLEQAAQQGGYAICAVSGGVDSTVAAYMAHRAFGDRMTAIFVDTGLMRSGEVENIRAAFEELEIPLQIVDRSGEILEKLAHRQSNEEKRAVVVSSIDEAMLRQSDAIDGEKTLVLGTNYSDWLDSGSAESKWSERGLAVVEPLLHMLKHEVRELAQQLSMSAQIVDRKPFPALGLGARIVGEVTGERLCALRMAEVLFREEIAEAGLERKLYKYFPVLIGNDSMAGREMMILRAVTLSGGQLVPARLPYDLIERTVQRIMTQSPAITRVFYDQTPTPIEKESFT